MKSKLYSALKISLIFLIVSSIYIVFSDRMILQIIGDSASAGRLNEIQSYKGLVFVFLTSVLLFVLIYREITRRVKYINQLEEQKKVLLNLSEEKNKLSAELSERKKFIETVLDNIPLGVAVNKFDKGTATYINNEFENIYGWPKNELVDIPNFFKKVYPDEKYREEIQHRIMKDIETGDRSKMHWEDIEITTQSGEKRIVNAKNIPLFEQNLMISTVQDVTEKKQAEETLRKSEERFRVAQDFSPDGFTILHPLRNELNEIVDFIWVYENQTIARINKTKPEDVTGKRLLDLFPTHKDTVVYETYIEVTNSGKPKILEEVYVGEVVKVPTWLRLVVVPMGEDIAILAQDITERKNAEVALLHSHNLMEYIIEHNQSAVAVLDKNLNYLYVSQRFFKDYRIKETNIIGKNHYEVFPEIPEKWKIIHQKALSGTTLRADEDIFYRKDGSFDWTRWECRPWYAIDGSVGGIILYQEVISEQKRKEEEIKKLNQRLEILIESIQQLSSAQSMESVQDTVVKSARKLIGADGATLVFRENNNCFYVNEDAVQPLWKGNHFPINQSISGWVMLNKKPVVIEDIYSDERIPKEIYNPTFIKSLAMVPIIISEPIGAIGNYWKENYTPTETELQLLQTLADAAARAIESINLYSELEERVKSRTEQLSAVNKELQTFTYSVSHDLKAPLRGIDGYSKLLIDLYGNQLNAEATHFISTIRSSALQMNQLIEDLLNYSRLERSELRMEKIKIFSFVNVIVSNMKNDFETGNFEISISVPDIEITADSRGLSIAMRNLLENARKFSRSKHEPSIKIGLNENNENWIIFVQDNGTGFDKKYHDRIFEIFQRLHRAEEYPGTGIGLAMVNKAMHRMNGKVWAESIPGEGATFYLEIPKIPKYGK